MQGLHADFKLPTNTLVVSGLVRAFGCLNEYKLSQLGCTPNVACTDQEPMCCRAGCSDHSDYLLELCMRGKVQVCQQIDVNEAEQRCCSLKPLSVSIAMPKPVNDPSAAESLYNFVLTR